MKLGEIAPAIPVALITHHAPNQALVVTLFGHLI